MDENLKERLINKKESGWNNLPNDKFNQIFDFCNGYIDFLNQSKTEREFVVNSVNLAKQNGF